MIIKPSTKLMKEYKSISNLAHETQQVIHITSNGDADLVVMSTEVYEMREEEFKLREKLFRQMNTKEPTISLAESKKRIKEKFNGKCRAKNECAK
jgi:PHD/YefM family antitoxin component YafN of YafNO toxin-antitoxin module